MYLLNVQVVGICIFPVYLKKFCAVLYCLSQFSIFHVIEGIIQEIFFCVNDFLNFLMSWEVRLIFLQEYLVFVFDLEFFSWLFIFIVFERQNDYLILHFLIHSPNALNSLGWARLKLPRAWNSAWVSHMGDKWPKHLGHLICLLGCTSTGSWFRRGASTGTPIWDVGIPDFPYEMFNF